MKVKKYINDPEELLRQGQLLVKENSDIKYAYRVSMVNLILSGMPAKELALHCGDGETTLMSWVTKVDREGWEALKAKKQPGKPSKLNTEQMETVRAAISGDPKDHGFDVWDGPSLSTYIKSTFSIELGVRACQKLFHKLGFSLIRPQTYPSLENPDDEAREAFKKKMTEIAQDESVVPVFQDEVHFQVQTSITAKWAPIGSEPKVMSKPGKQSVAYSGYLIPDTGELIVTKPSWFNYETVIQSFRDCISSYALPEGKKLCIVLDNAPWHKKAIRLIWAEQREEYQDIRDAMTYLNLPPYSPDLNPIEQVWRITRKEVTHNRYFSSKELLEATLDNYYARYRTPNEKLKSLCSFKCFREKETAQ